MNKTILLLTLVVVVSCQQTQQEYPIYQLSGASTSYVLPQDILITSIRSLPSGFIAITDAGKGLALLNNEFELIKHYDKPGFGPGEIRKIERFDVNDNRIVVLDSEKRSIDIFDVQLNYLESLTPEERLTDLILLENNDIIAHAFSMNSWYLVRYSGDNYSESQIIFSQSTRSPEQGMGQLLSRGDQLVFNQVFTNQSTLIDLNTFMSTTLINNSLPQRAEMISGPIGAIPVAPVYRGGTIMDEKLWQYAKNADSEVLSVYILNFDDRILARFDLDILPEAVAVRNDSLFALKNEGIISYLIQNHD
jgi:hypothetical protein